MKKGKAISKTPPPAFDTVPISSWRDFQTEVTGPEYRTWAFRGQEDATWPLFSSLSRYLRKHGVHAGAWAEQEARIYRIFKRKAHLYLDHVPTDDDAFQWLALMQHHGAPTRLLDLTWSPYVALFFALQSASQDSAVWAVSFPTIWRVKQKFPNEKKLIGMDYFSLRNAGAYERYYLGNQVRFVSIGEPFVMNQRLIAQSGTFIVPGVLDVPVEDILSGYPAPGKSIIKFVIQTSKVRDEAMLSLYNMNITNATLFPGLDGMAKSLAYELECNWAYNPRTMEPHRGYEV
jgi:hypothetical protein